MIQRLNVNVPLNSVSFGNVSFNILREFYRKGITCAIFPKGGNVDLSAYKIEPGFGAWLEQGINQRYSRVDRKVPTFTVWHISESQFKASDKQFLLTFHETSEPTKEECNILKQQDFTFFSSSYSVNNFKEAGVDNVGYIPLGLDEDFVRIEERLMSKDVIHTVVIGKAEKRKRTEQMIKIWIKKFGGNHRHQLTLLIDNPFFKPEQMQAFYQNLFENGQKPFNVNILPRVKTNAEMNQLYNSADISLNCSGGEGWDIPAHTATALGKWAVVSNATSHKDWATKDNSILVEPNGMEVCYDNFFFAPGQPFNQGSFYTFTDEAIAAGLDEAVKRFGAVNEEGLKLAKITYAITAEKILEKIGD